MRSNLIDVDVTVHHVTTKMQAGEDRGAWLVETDVSSPKKVWVPKSLCEVDQTGKQAIMTLSESLATEKELI